MDFMPQSESVQDQRSASWHAARRTRVGASEIAILAGISPYKTIAELWDEKKKGTTTETTYIQQKGINAEAGFKEFIEKRDGFYPLPEVFMTDYGIASLDGLNPAKTEAYEFKLVGADYFQAVKAGGDIRPDHMMQMRYQVMISGIRNIIYCLYCESLNEYYTRGLFFQTNAEEFKHMEELAKKFLASLLLEENPFSEAEQQIQDEALLASLEELESIDDEIKELEQKKSFIRDSVKEVVKSGKAKCGAFQIAWSERKGNVDYAKIPVLKGLDLEPFRKKPIPVMTISRTKNANPF